MIKISCKNCGKLRQQLNNIANLTRARVNTTIKLANIQAIADKFKKKGEENEDEKIIKKIKTIINFANYNPHLWQIIQNEEKEKINELKNLLKIKTKGDINE